MKTRIISAIVIIAIFVPILLLGGLPFAIFMGILSAFGLYELIKTRESQKKFPKLMKVFAYVMAIAFCMYNYDSIEFSSQFDYRVMALLLFLFLSQLYLLIILISIILGMHYS